MITPRYRNTLASTVVLTVIQFFSTATQATINSVHCPLGCPSNPQANSLLFGHVYALSNNPNTKFADWVAYEVDILNFGVSPGRKWLTEPLLDQDKTLETDDYKGAHSSELKADRGHQAPLASFAGSKYWAELNHLSNITPQHKDLNQGPWKALEDAVRSAVAFRQSLYVITGTLYQPPKLQLPNADETHQVPSSYFKVVYDLKGNATAFVMAQSAGRNDSHCDKIRPIGELSRALSFSLPALQDSGETARRLGCR